VQKDELAERSRRFEGFDLDGGHPALDFTNTVDWRGTAREHDWLGEPEDLAAWAHRTGLLEQEEAAELYQYIGEHPEAATRFLTTVKRLREILFRLFRALQLGESPLPEDLRLFNDLLRRALSPRTLLAPASEAHGLYRLAFAGGEDPPERFLNKLLRQAADLLSTADPHRLKVCSTPDCGWLFIDSTKNSSRRWCDMASCGNRAKAKRFYSRKKAATQQAD
jgi:predicted RNA-binding Zn ribbon-like protein